MYQTIRVEHREAVATVWLDRPEVHNAFNELLIEELDVAVADLEADPRVRVVVLGGRGNNFCAGADLHWMRRAAAATEEQNLLDAQRFAAMLRRIATLSKPTVARVQGAAMGGGVGLAAACDICIADDQASFCMTEVRLGLTPAVISPYVIRAIGARQALRYMQSAERVDAKRAQHLGLVHELATGGSLDECVAGICRELCIGSPAAQAAAKALVLANAAGAIDDAALDRSARAIARQRASPEAREGIAAFLAKRKAAWRV